MKQIFKSGEIIPKTGIYICQYIDKITGNSETDLVIAAVWFTAKKFDLDKHSRIPIKRIKRFLIAGQAFPDYPGFSEGWKYISFWKFWQWLSPK